MASIDQFEAQLLGGGPRANRFRVFIPRSGDKIEFLCQSAQIPAAQVGVVEQQFRGHVLKLAGDRTFEPWTVTIINDTDFIIRDAMEKWSNSINDLQTAQGTISPEVYQRSAQVKQLSREGTNPGDPEKVLRMYNFEGIYPNTVSNIPLDFGATDQIEEFQVTFNYLFYEVSSPTGNF